MRAIARIEPVALTCRGDGHVAVQDDPVAEWRRQRLLDLWDSAHLLQGSVAGHYLDRRAIDIAPAALRFHPRTPLGSGGALKHRPTVTILFIWLAVVIVGLAWRALRVPLKHRWRRRRARDMSAALRGRDRMQPAPPIYARLRAMDARAFEELLLESFECRAYRVIRDHWYTGGGGIDGQVVIRGRIWPIQVKCYAPAIRPEHLLAFAALCRDRAASALFIHTGRTGGASHEVAARYDVVEIISGQRLLALVTGAPLVIDETTL